MGVVAEVKRTRGQAGNDRQAMTRTPEEEAAAYERVVTVSSGDHTTAASQLSGKPLRCTPVVPDLLDGGRDGLVPRDVPLQHIPGGQGRHGSDMWRGSKRGKQHWHMLELLAILAPASSAHLPKWLLSLPAWAHQRLMLAGTQHALLMAAEPV